MPNLRTQADYLNEFKRYKGWKSDYQIARHWNESTATISQYRSGRLRLPIVYIIEIAEIAYYNPLEIILELELPKAKERHRAKLVDAHWRALLTAISDRMNINSPINTNRYIHHRFKKFR